MKYYIIRHEKAFSMTFNIMHILLKVASFLLVSAVAINGAHYAMMHYKLPVTSEKASYYITSFIENWIFLTFVIFAFWVFLRYITTLNWNSLTEILKKSVLYGLAAQIFFYCFYFCLLSNMALANFCFCFFPIYIILEGVRKLFQEEIGRASHEQRLRLLKCLRRIAKVKYAVIKK